MTPTLQDLKTLTQRKELLYLLRECETLPDSTLTALATCCGPSSRKRN